MKARIPIIDGHNDTLTKLFLSGDNYERPFADESLRGHLDLPKARQGGFAGGLFSICVPAPESSPERSPIYGLKINKTGYEIKYPQPLEFEYAEGFANDILDFAFRIERQSNGNAKIVRDYGELERLIENDILAMILHFEGAEPIKADLSNLEGYYQRGLRSLCLTWSRPNSFGNGVQFCYPHSPDTGSGLKFQGKELVKTCNELGIIIDLAHINEKGFWDGAKLSKQPLVASHTAVHSLCPSSRNLTDDQIDAIGDSNGVIGIIFEAPSIRMKIKDDLTPEFDIPLNEIINHFDYIINRIGIDHAGFGSDFDGTDMPAQLKDASCLPQLLESFRKSGFDEESLEKIAYRNWLRVIKDTWRS